MCIVFCPPFLEEDNRKSRTIRSSQARAAVLAKNFSGVMTIISNGVFLALRRLLHAKAVAVISAACNGDWHPVTRVVVQGAS